MSSSKQITIYYPSLVLFWTTEYKSFLPHLIKDAIVKMHTSCVISWVFHVSGLSEKVEEMPMGITKREPIHESYETASGPIPYKKR